MTVSRLYCHNLKTVRKSDCHLFQLEFNLLLDAMNGGKVWSPVLAPLQETLHVHFQHSLINIYTLFCFRLCERAASFLFRSGSWNLSGLWRRVNIRIPVKRR